MAVGSYATAIIFASACVQVVAMALPRPYLVDVVGVPKDRPPHITHAAETEMICQIMREQ